MTATLLSPNPDTQAPVDQPHQISAESRYAQARAAMVDSQLRPNAVDDRRLIAAINVLPREQFVPAAFREVAYMDRPVPLGDGREMNPALPTARMVLAADVRASDHVLLIGSASGYTAALLAAFAHHVTAVDSASALVATARTLLAKDSNIRIIDGPMADGAVDGGPYDLLFIDGAVDRVPASLVAQMKEGARVVAGIDDQGVRRLARGIVMHGQLALLPFADIESVRLPGFDAPKGFRF